MHASVRFYNQHCTMVQGLYKCATLNQEPACVLPALELPLKTERKTIKENIYSPESIQFQLAQLLLLKIKEHLPNHKKPDLQKWAKNMDAILCLDQRDPEEVKEVINYAQDDPFWQANVMSVDKLRQHYDRLNLRRTQILTGPETWPVLNDDSVVARLDCGQVEFLFSGDAEAPAEAFLPGDISAEILKVGHHGSASSSSTCYLSRVKPQVAIISVGGDNDYGHPAPETLANLQAMGVKIYRTDLNGDVIVTTDGNTRSVHTEKGLSSSNLATCCRNIGEFWGRNNFPLIEVSS